MKKQIMFTIGAISMLLSGHSFANTDMKVGSANTVMWFCEDRNSSICLSYMAGFTQGVMAGLLLNPSQNRLSSFTLRDMFIKYMQDHPEQGDTDVFIVLAKVAIKANAVKWRNHP